MSLLGSTALCPPDGVADIVAAPPLELRQTLPGLVQIIAPGRSVPSRPRERIRIVALLETLYRTVLR